MCWPLNADDFMRRRGRFTLRAAIATIAVATAANAQLPGAEIIRLDDSFDALVAPGTTIEKVAGDFRFTEGPMWRDGRLWISDVVADTIFAVSPSGTAEALVMKAGGYPDPPPGSYLGPNAMVTDKDGTVLLAQQGGRKLVRIDEHLALQPFLDSYEGKKFNSPNDLVFAPDGSLWFTDPPYGLAGRDADPAKELRYDGVYRYANGKLTLAVKDLTLPNGIGFSPDGKWLYVANSGPRMRVVKYAVGKHGTVSAGKSLIEFADTKEAGVPDGLKIDSAGNVWTTGPGGVRIVRPDGKVLGQIKLPEMAANLAWADQGKTLYITARTGVYRLKVLTPGVMPLYQK